MKVILNGERWDKTDIRDHTGSGMFQINLPLLYGMDRPRRCGWWADKALLAEIAKST